jgi:hypothetical protein
MARKTGPIQAVLAATILILWVTGIIAAYYVIHKPWGMQLPVAPFLAVLDIFLSMAMIGLAGGLGIYYPGRPSRPLKVVFARVR